LQAAQSCLEQTLQPNEIIVVDNGSNTLPRDGYFPDPVQTLTEEKSGAGFARLAGVAQSVASHFLFLDSDDLLDASALQNLAIVSMESGADVTFGAIQNFQDYPEGRALGKISNYPLASSSLISSQCFEAYGLFEGDNYSFSVWIEKLRASGANFENIDQVVAQRRIHSSNMGFSKESRRFYLDMARSRLEARRK